MNDSNFFEVEEGIFYDICRRWEHQSKACIDLGMRLAHEASDNQSFNIEKSVFEDLGEQRIRPKKLVIEHSYDSNNFDFEIHYSYRISPDHPNWERLKSGYMGRSKSPFVIVKKTN